MAWYHRVAGRAAQGAGRAIDYATPGAGSSRLTNAGRAIVDPNQVYTGSPLAYVSGVQSGGGSQFRPVTEHAIAGGSTNPAGTSNFYNRVTPGGTRGLLGASTSDPNFQSQGGAAPYDPMAEKRNSFLAGLPGAIGNIGANARDAFGSGGRNLRGAAEGLYNKVNQGQRSINASRENVELNRLSGMGDVLKFVRSGLKSGAARLANMNSLESSAAGELGRVFSEEGSARSRGVSNQAFLQNRELDTSQEGLELEKGQGKTDFNRTRDDIVANIGSQIRNQLAALDAEAQGMGITGKIAIDQEKQRLLDEGMAQLAEVDAWLQSQMGGVAPQDMATTRRNAIALQQGGQGDITPFSFGEFAPEVQGAPIDQLPLFTRNRKQRA